MIYTIKRFSKDSEGLDKTALGFGALGAGGFLGGTYWGYKLDNKIPELIVKNVKDKHKVSEEFNKEIGSNKALRKKKKKEAHEALDKALEKEKGKIKNKKLLAAALAASGVAAGTYAAHRLLQKKKD